MQTEAQEPINVMLVGMDERSVARMTTIFKVIYKGRCEITQGEHAILGIVDLDSESTAWNKFRQQYPDLPAIVISESPAFVEGATYVAKPAKLNLLWDSIFNLVTDLPPVSEVPSKVDSAEISSVTPLKPKKTSVNTAASAMEAQFKTKNTGSKSIQQSGSQNEIALYYNPNNYLLGSILSSLKKYAGRECTIHVQCWTDRRLILLPDQERAYTDLTDSQLKNLGIATLNEEFVIEIDAICGVKKGQPPKNEFDGLRSMSIDYFIWDLTLRTARGRVPQDIDLSYPYYLKRWPNFPRLPHTPHGMRITSLWVENPRTLDDIAKTLGIEQADIFSFYSAVEAIGLVGSAKRQADFMISPKDVIKKERTRRSLLTSILRRITSAPSR